MERMLLPPLLLLLFLGLDPSHAPRPTLAGNCNPADTIPVMEGENRNISTEVRSKSGMFIGSIELFVMPDSGFKGVSLVVQGSGGMTHAAWFPADEECFPRDGRWVQFRAMTDMASNVFSLAFKTGACLVLCSLDHALQGPGSFTVVADGRSDWLKVKPSSDCSILMTASFEGKTKLSCQEPPSTTNPTTTIVIATTATGLVVVLVAVAVYCKRRKVMPPRPAGLAPPRQEPQVIENDDIYESFDGLANSAAPQTFHNELYESLSGYGHRHDS